MEYNSTDVTLVKEINDKLKIIEFFNQIRCKACSQMEMVYHNSVLIDGLLLYKLHNKLVLPSKKENEEDTFIGAYVSLPEKGIYTDVLGLDVKGLYPAIIRTFNIGYETFNPNGEIKVEEGIGFNRGEGVISSLAKDLEEERNKYKRLRSNAKTKSEYEVYDWKQYAIKIFANSLFGYLGFPKSRLYMKEVASAITGLGRKIIKWTATVLKNKGYEIMYQDTDSAFIKSKTDGLLELIKEGRDLVEEINKTYINFAKSHGTDSCNLEIEFEKIFKKILFVSKKSEEKGAKKKYAYILSWKDGKTVDGKVEFVGFAAKRSNTPRIAREIQKKVIELIFDGRTKEEVIDYLETTEKLIRKREIPDEEISFPVEIKKALSSYGKEITRKDGKIYQGGVPPVISGARYANKYLGAKFSKGMKPKWIYLKSVPPGYPETKVITFEKEIPEGFIPDIDVVIKKLFKEKLEEIFKAAGFGEFPNLNSNVQTMDKWLK
jgi:DNA polymerase I